MGRYLGSSCKLCRKEKSKLFLKGEKCDVNCILDKGKRKNLPGQHGISKTKTSEYGKHLHEKQKAKYIYGVSEKQFRNYFRIASKMKGLTGTNLLMLLERRLDNVVHKLGFASSKKFARQLIVHRHILVNNKLKKVPGYLVKPGDKISIKDRIKDNIFVKKSIENASNIPSWLNLDKTNFIGEVVSLPTREDISYPIDESLIVELYSR